jgi:predicted HD phosphohydrolase
LHVRAKRYLVSVDRDYAARLSPLSQHSLTVQGGALAPAERAAFEALSFADAAVRLRRWDDAAKVERVSLPDMATFAPVVRSVLRSISAPA